MLQKKNTGTNVARYMHTTHSDKPTFLKEQRGAKSNFAHYFEESAKLSIEEYKEEERKERYLSFMIHS